MSSTPARRTDRAPVESILSANGLAARSAVQIRAYKKEQSRSHNTLFKSDALHWTLVGSFAMTAALGIAAYTTALDLSGMIGIAGVVLFLSFVTKLETYYTWRTQVVKNWAEIARISQEQGLPAPPGILHGVMDQITCTHPGTFFRFTYLADDPIVEAVISPDKPGVGILIYDEHGIHNLS